MLRELKGTQPKPRALFIIMDTTGPTISEGASDVTVTKNGTGDVTLTYKNAFRRNACVGASCASGDYASLNSSSATACRVIVKTDAGVAADGVLHVQIQGWDSADQF